MPKNSKRGHSKKHSKSRQNYTRTKIANKVSFVVQANISSLYKKNIKNLSIETIETSKDNIQPDKPKDVIGVLQDLAIYDIL